MNYHNYNNRGNTLWTMLILFTFFGGFKLFFVIFGLLLAILINFFPFIIGGWILYKLFIKSKYNNTMNSYVQSRSHEHQQFVELLIRTLCHVIHADGKVDIREKQSLLSFFQIQMRFSKTQMDWVTDLLEHSLKDTTDINELCAEITRNFDQHAQHMILELLYAVAMADQEFHADEERIIQNIASKLHIPAHEQERIKETYIPKTSETDHHYAILGLNRNASKDDIKKAYRKLSKEHHPDKVMHLGEEFRKIAEEKMQKLNKAYATLY